MPSRAQECDVFFYLERSNPMFPIFFDVHRFQNSSKDNVKHTSLVDTLPLQHRVMTTSQLAQGTDQQRKGDVMMLVAREMGKEGALFEQQRLFPRQARRRSALALTVALPISQRSGRELKRKMLHHQALRALLTRIQQRPQPLFFANSSLPNSRQTLSSIQNLQPRCDSSCCHCSLRC